MSIEPESHIVFGPYRLDAETQQLWQGEQVVVLQPKPLAVLQYLAEHPGQVVSSKELLKMVWTGTVVSRAVVKECLRAIRAALGEDAVAPHYIETVGREGYRFLGTVASSQHPVVRSSLPTQDSILGTQHSVLVGREAELARLQAALHKALNGERQLMFLTGEPGIGKTTILDLFREQIRTNGNLTIGYGQCIEQYGGEAYLPILEAVGRLCRETEGQHIAAMLRRYAPTWLVQLSSVIDDAEVQTLRLQVQGATQQRMLREMAEALEQLTRQQPLLLVLEDLHWSDQATVELLSYLAQRRERARLLILGAYRPADLVLGSHPLKAIKQELQAKRQCEEVRLELLSLREIRDYLSKRFLQQQFPSALADEIHRRTEGNALFMVNVVEEFLQQERIVKEQECWVFKGDITQIQTPDTLRQLIEKQVQQRSDEEQQVLEAASVVGTEFAVAAVAAALQQNVDIVEEICEELAWQGHFLEERGVARWPDGTVSGCYAFRHLLYKDVLYQLIAEARRIRWHSRIGNRIEKGYRMGIYGTFIHRPAIRWNRNPVSIEKPVEVEYAEKFRKRSADLILAIHFEYGRELERAASYRQQVGRRAISCVAYKEAMCHFTRRLELLSELPETNEHERTRKKSMLQKALDERDQMLSQYPRETSQWSQPRIDKLSNFSNWCGVYNKFLSFWQPMKFWGSLRRKQED